MPNAWPDAFSCHLPVEPDTRDWGLRVIHSGFAEIPPGAPYPLPRPEYKKHHAYWMTWQRGRTLQEFQVVYIGRGRGVFESKPTGRVRIEAGMVFLLFPGVWHRYRPVPQTGWSEHYIGFDGWYAERLLKAFFAPEKAVLRVGIDQELLLQIHSLKAMLAAAPIGYRQIMAGRTTEILARIRSLAASHREEDREQHAKIQTARRLLLEHAEASHDLSNLARELGMSYTQFRALFKRESGLSPRQYQIDIRINKARDLLRHTDRSVHELAAGLGFSSVHYFSRLFKLKTGLSPLDWRKGGGAEKAISDR
jgi:AraC-like DNA-binding protein